jgi:hypothetical protein
MQFRIAIPSLIAVLAACATAPENPPLATTSRADAVGAAVARRPLETPAIPPVALAPPSYPIPAPLPQKIVVPPKAQYVCVIDTKSKQQQTAIEFAPKVATLCRKHPEMGPCQYERNNCRASGGRVFTADGGEITMATEAEYDKKVMRVRFRAN